MIDRPWHYADAVARRLFLIAEYRRLKRIKTLESGLLTTILRSPSSAEDWINLLCFLDPGEPLTVIDVGANVGDFAIQALKHFPRATCHCFEPCAAPFAVLERRFAGDARVHRHKYALGAAPDRRDIFVQAPSAYSSFHRYDGAVNDHFGLCYDRVESVDVARLDAFDIATDGPVLLKIDTQGHEVEVLVGATAVLDAVDVALIEVSFAAYFENLEPSFVPVATLLAAHDLLPIAFQEHGRAISNYAYERDVVFVRRPLLGSIFFAET